MDSVRTTGKVSKLIYGLASVAALAGLAPSASLASSSSASTVTVYGTSAIPLAGRTDVTIAPPGPAPAGYPLTRNSPPGPYSEMFPTEISASSGQVFQFQASGTITVDAENNYSAFGPEGGTNSHYSYISMSMGPLAGISGFEGPTGALVGVFLNNNNPVNSTAPETLTYPEAPSFTSASPALGQVFYIGDGLIGGNGSEETFNAPAGATRLFLGIPDASGNYGPAGGYDDNAGSYTVTVISAVPEASTLCLLVPAMLTLGRRRQTKQIAA